MGAEGTRQAAVSGEHLAALEDGVADEGIGSAGHEASPRALPLRTAGAADVPRHRSEAQQQRIGRPLPPP
ncbi:hypothetical protein FM069_02645 [Pseudomonas mangiferae]|uniref:Uncharacterized protein n=1 Tax=Pseudomonas mangiferae TaxID=2593654 RepID=A0A553H2Y9_9PSED|nr:hypothetical protein FM069_02645 [Pseudomonas mangiferae]